MRLAVFIFAVISPSLIIAQEKATTSDGREVILHSNGTWEYAERTPSAVDWDRTDFRNTRWGMSKDQVKAVEVSELGQEINDLGGTIGIDALGYKTRLLNLDTLILYVFANDKLVRAQYRIVETHSNKNDYIDDHSLVKQAIRGKYGDPDRDDNIWKNDLYKDDRQQFGFAVGYGHLVYVAQWKTDHTSITQVLQGENFEIEHVVEYGSAVHGHLEEELKKKKAKNEL